MISIAIDPPNLSLDTDKLVDWLELCALFDEFGVVRMDELISSLRQLAEEDGSDFGEDDRLQEELVARIEEEIEYRSGQLPGVYPFELGAGAEELSLVANWMDIRYAFYLICLITSHVTKSPILARPPAGDLLTELRNRIFQIMATLAMAGIANGSAISVGWPRVLGEPLVDVLTRAEQAGAGFTVRRPPGPFVPPKEKDGGIDVIAWSGDLRPPPTHFYFAQAASGNNWPGKPVSGHAAVFKTNYMQDMAAANVNHFTLIPFRVADQNEWFNESILHSAILDRLRVPLKAWEGLQRAHAGGLVDDADSVALLSDWLRPYTTAAVA